MSSCISSPETKSESPASGCGCGHAVVFDGASVGYRRALMGVIAINSGYLNALDEMTRRRVSESTKPVIVGLPSGMHTVPEERRSRQIAELIRRAIGFRITFPGG